MVGGGSLHSTRRAAPWGDAELEDRLLLRHEAEECDMRMGTRMRDARTDDEDARRTGRGTDSAGTARGLKTEMRQLQSCQSVVREPLERGTVTQAVRGRGVFCLSARTLSLGEDA